MGARQAWARARKSEANERRRTEIRSALDVRSPAALEEEEAEWCGACLLKILKRSQSGTNRRPSRTSFACAWYSISTRTISAFFESSASSKARASPLGSDSVARAIWRGVWGVG